jgi:hypothetical protein
MQTVTPNRHTAQQYEDGAQHVDLPTVTAPTITPNKRFRKAYLLVVNALLTAKQSRQVKKLESISELILSQEPLAIIPTIIKLATLMNTHNEKSFQQYAPVAKFNTKDNKGVLYIPKSARIDVPMTCSVSIKENKKAIALLAKGVQNCSATQVALANTMKKMAQLELEIHVKPHSEIRLHPSCPIFVQRPCLPHT